MDLMWMTTKHTCHFLLSVFLGSFCVLLCIFCLSSPPSFSYVALMSDGVSEIKSTVPYHTLVPNQMQYPYTAPMPPAWNTRLMDGMGS
jgi:hypothetical protein